MKKIVLIGPECTGKSTLGKYLSTVYRCQYVSEYSRKYALERGGGDVLTVEDVLPIVKGQVFSEDNAQGEMVFLDSNPLASAVYSRWYYGVVPYEVERIIEEREYDFYLLCSPDIPWQQDRTRSMDSQSDRDSIFQCFLRRVKNSGVPYQIISGLGQERVVEAICALEEKGFILKEKTV